jgi:hypothetical protein
MGHRIRNVQEPAVELKLDAHALNRLEGDNRWRLVVCQKGVVWITQERDPRDYVLTAGDLFLVTEWGKVLVQALQAASVQITPSLKSAPYTAKQLVFP